MSPNTQEKMSKAELIATILGKSDPDDECRRMATLLDKWGVVVDPCEYGVTGSGRAAAMKRMDKVHAGIELGRRLIIDKQQREATTITTPEDAVSLMTPHYAGLQREVFYALCLSTKNKLIKMAEVSVGSLNSSIVHPRELYREAIRCSAASIVVVHNHPSGDPEPSTADIQLTRRLARAGEVLGIELLDHVVIGGEGRHTSMRHRGIL